MSGSAVRLLPVVVCGIAALLVAFAAVRLAGPFSQLVDYTVGARGATVLLLTFSCLMVRVLR